MSSVDRVKKLCKERRVAISRLEKDLGFGNGYIGQLKKGVLPDDRLRMIADYFDVPISFILGEEEKEKPTVKDDGLSDNLRELIQTVKGLPEEKVQMLLQVAKSIK